MKTIIKYIGIALVIAGILLVMKNLVTKDTDLLDKKNNKEYYSVEIKLLNKETKEYVEGAKLVLKDKNRNVVMYNNKLTNEEIKVSNSSKDNVEVDNTLSSKSINTVIISLKTTIVGFGLIYKVRKSY